MQSKQSKIGQAMVYRCFLVFCLIWVNTLIFGQTNLGMVDVRSPNASELGTFGEIPVSKFTGTPNISIPLMEMKGQQISVPLQLNYHPGNIKPNQRPGWVGFGWNLSLGSIYREIRGTVDEFNTDASTQTGYYFRRNLTGDSWTKLGEADNLDGPQRVQWHRSMSSMDFEADIFHFSINGLQGKFFLDHNGKWQVQSDQYMTVELDPSQPFIDPLIKYAFASSFRVTPTFNKFILRDGDGNTYVFGGVSATEYSWNIGANISFESMGVGLHATSWNIIEIKSATSGDRVEYSYERGPFVSTLYKNANYNQTYKSATCQSYSYTNWRTEGGVVSPVYPKEIKFNGQKLTFSISKAEQLSYKPSDYEDMFLTDPEQRLIDVKEVMNGAAHSYVPYFKGVFQRYYSDLLVWMKLDSLKLYNGAGSLVNAIKLTYNNLPTERLFLEKVTALEESGYAVKSHSFVYDQKNILPKYLECITDHWGFNNGSLFTVQFNPASIFNSRQPNSTYLKAGILKEIVYPTGGKSVFDFELGDYSATVDPDNCKNLIAGNGAGNIRISKIESYDEYGIFRTRKEYFYKKNWVKGNGTISSGILAKAPKYFKGTTTETDMSGGSFSFSWFSSNSLENLDDGEGVSIGYSEVTEVIGDSNKKSYQTDYYTNHDNGYTDNYSVYNFKAALLNNKPINSRAFLRGREDRSIMYDNSKNKVRAIQNIWTVGDTTLGNSRSLLFNFMDVASGCNVGYYYPSSVAYLNYSFPFLLTTVRDSTFLASGTTVIMKNDTYDFIMKRLRKSTVTGSDGISDSEEYTYANDYALKSGYANSVLKRLVDLGLSNRRIETVIKRNTSVVSALLSEYAFRNGLVVESKNYLLDKPSVSTGFTPLTLNLGNYQKDAAYQIQSEIVDFDSRGNPLEVKQKKGASTTYLWGYGGRYPVAKIENATYTEVLTALGGGATATGKLGVLDSLKVAEETIKTTIEGLRTSLKKSQVFGYTYKDLVGMTSKIDPRGILEYFEYDSFGRLSVVKDNDGNIVKTYCYNYSGQKIDCTNIFHNVAKSQVFTKKNCPTWYTGNSVTYTVPAGKYSSTISQSAADQLAQNDINTNGQNYANTVGTCSDGTFTFYVNNMLDTWVDLRFTPISGGATAVSVIVPANTTPYGIVIKSGTYNVGITTGFGNIRAMMGCGYYAEDSSSILFENVNISEAGCFFMDFERIDTN